MVGLVVTPVVNTPNLNCNQLFFFSSPTSGINEEISRVRKKVQLFYLTVEEVFFPIFLFNIFMICFDSLWEFSSYIFKVAREAKSKQDIHGEVKFYFSTSLREVKIMAFKNNLVFLLLLSLCFFSFFFINKTIKKTKQKTIKKNYKKKFFCLVFCLVFFCLVCICLVFFFSLFGSFLFSFFCFAMLHLMIRKWFAAKRRRKQHSWSACNFNIFVKIYV